MKFVFRLILFILVFSLFAESDRKKHSLVLYRGKYTETDFSPILFRQDTKYLDSYINVLGYNRPLYTRLRFATFETEFDFAKHSGIMNHFEAGGILIARSDKILGSNFSLAFGEGISIASENPKLENRKTGIRILGNDYDFLTGAYILTRLNFFPLGTEIQTDTIKSRNALNFIIFELDYQIPKLNDSLKVFMRVHHRSGIFGLYCPPDPACGSNFISYGVKLSL